MLVWLLLLDLIDLLYDLFLFTWIVGFLCYLCCWFSLLFSTGFDVCWIVIGWFLVFDLF